jgi:hypothetical protein
MNAAGSRFGSRTSSLLSSLTPDSRALNTQLGGRRFYHALLDSMDGSVANRSLSTAVSGGGVFPGGLELVPEPSGILLLAAGFATTAIFLSRRRRLRG